MKYILEIILILITITCFASLMEYQRETSNLKAKLNQTNSILHKLINNDTTLNKSVLTQEFKEDYYLTQQQLNQDQIILYITLLFSIIAIVGFFIFFHILQSVKEEIITDNTNKQNKQDTLIQHTHNDINNIGFSFATSILLTADAVKNIDQNTYVFQTLLALTVAKHFGHHIHSKDFLDSLILTYLENLNITVSIITTAEPAQRDELWKYLLILTSTQNLEIKTQIALLSAKINDQ